MKKNLKLISHILIALGVIIIFYVLILDRQESDYQQTVNIISDQTGKTIEINEAETENIENNITTSTYRLIIDSIGVNMDIVFGENETQAFLKGAWHFPGSGTPDNPEGYKNIVLSAHRYLHTSGPNTFFNLDKVKKDDIIIIKWDEEEYQYKVTKVYIVGPKEVSILKDTGVEKLTLFTCHPVFTTEQRLVVEAYPIK